MKQEIFSLHFNVPPLYCLVVNGGIRSFLTGFDGEKFIDIGIGMLLEYLGWGGILTN